MVVETATDRLVFFNTDEFGVAVTKGADSFNGIFDNDSDDELDIDGQSSILTCRTDDVTAFSVVRGDTLIISGVSYTVREIKNDAVGISLLSLEQQ